MPSTTIDAAAGGRLGRLAGAVTRHPRRVVALWVLVPRRRVRARVGHRRRVVHGLLRPPAPSPRRRPSCSRERFERPSVDTLDLVWRRAGGARSATVVRRIQGVIDAAERLPGVRPGTRASAAAFSADGRTALVRLPLEVRAEKVPDATARELVALARRASTPGVTVAVGGSPVQRAESTGLPGEAIGLAVAALVLLLAVGSVVAAGLPLVTALFGVGSAVAGVMALAAVVDVPDWGLSVAAMIGLGVGIDYALLLLMRQRAALAAGRPVAVAVHEAVATAGGSVLVAGGTVVVSLSGLFLMGLTYLQGVALATILAVLVVMAASVTLLPALLTLLGTRVGALPVPGLRRPDPVRGGAGAQRWARAVQRRPRSALVAGLALVLVLAAPVTGMRLGFPDAGNDRPGSMNRQAFDLVARGFGPGASGPLLVVVSGGSGDASRPVAALRRSLAADRGVASVAPAQRSRDGGATLMTVTPKSAPQDQRTRDLITRVRDELAPAAVAGTRASVLVGGATAATVDQAQVTGERLPRFIASVVGLAMLLLLASFRSLPIAVKAAVLNLLSIAAAYGIVALLARGGWAGGLVGIEAATPVPPYIPVMLFAILFGLSMDYEVFLVSRIREARLDGMESHEAVTAGLGATARVITAAAANHGRRLRSLRAGRRRGPQAHRRRSGHSGPGRRDGRPDAPGPRGDAAARGPRLVDAAAARASASAPGPRARRRPAPARSAGDERRGARTAPGRTGPVHGGDRRSHRSSGAPRARGTGTPAGSATRTRGPPLASGCG